MSNQNSELQDFLEGFPSKKFTKQELLLDIDQKLSHVLYLKKGYVRQYSVSADGDEFTHNIFRRKTIFPLNLALHHQENHYYFEGLSDGEIILVPLSDMLSFLKTHPDVLFDLTQRLAAGLNQLLYRLDSLVFGSAQQKIAAAVCLLAKRFGEKVNKVKQEDCPGFGSDKALIITAFSVTHQHLAYLTGLTRETVSVEMMNLKQMGLIDYQSQKICILKPDELKEISSLPFYF